MSIQNHQLNYRESHMILIGWVRYCLGRKTYAVSECCDWLKVNWKELHPNTQAVIYRDIREEIEMDNRMQEIQRKKIETGENVESVSNLRFWDDCDRDKWESTLKIINAFKRPSSDRQCEFKVGDRVRALVGNQSTGTVSDILPEGMGIEIILDDVNYSKVIVSDKLLSVIADSGFQSC